MTIEEIIGCDADTLEKMEKSGELLKHFEAMFPKTRPEMQSRQVTQQQRVLTLNPNLAKGMALAKANGIDIDLSLLTRGKRK